MPALSRLRKGRLFRAPRTAYRQYPCICPRSTILSAADWSLKTAEAMGWYGAAADLGFKSAIHRKFNSCRRNRRRVRFPRAKAHGKSCHSFRMRFRGSRQVRGCFMSAMATCFRVTAWYCRPVMSFSTSSRMVGPMTYAQDSLTTGHLSCSHGTIAKLLNLARSSLSPALTATTIFCFRPLVDYACCVKACR